MKVYNMLFEDLNKIPAIAAQIFLKMNEVTDPKESNCKVLAQRILHFKFGDIIPKIQAALGEMHTFLHTSYKGAYCSLCDAHTHSLINIDSKEITFSEGFCREIVSHSLHPLTYLHIHFKKLMDLAVSFVTFCDNEGEFNPEEAVPPSALLEVQEADKKLLNDCKKFRNDAGWMEYCSGICEKFKFSDFDEFFQPDIKKYHKAILFMQEKLLKFSPPEQNLEEMEKEAEKEAEEPEDEKKKEEENKEGAQEGNQENQENQPQQNQQSPQQQAPQQQTPQQQAPETAEARNLRLLKRRKYARYLKEEGEASAEEENTPKEGEAKTEGGEGEEEGEEEEPTLMDLEKKYEKMMILHKSMNAVVPLDKMSGVFSDPGIDLFTIGKGAHITEENYILVKGLALVENQKVEKVETPVKESQLILQTMISSLFFIFILFKLN